MMSVVTERVGSDGTGPALTKRMSVILSRTLFSSFDSFDFIGRRSSESKVGRTCKRRAELRRGGFEAPFALKGSPASPRWYSVSRARMLAWIVSARQTTKGARQKEHGKISLFPVAINPSLIEPNSRGSPLTRMGIRFEQFPLSGGAKRTARRSNPVRIPFRSRTPLLTIKNMSLPVSKQANEIQWGI